MAVKVGNSWVSEAALAHAKSAVESGGNTESSVLSDLSERYKDTNFTTSTAPFQGKGTNNIGISPNILRQMEQDPEKRLEYEALIYDCVEVQKSGVFKGSNVVASGFIINADGSLGAWSISKSGGEKLRRQTKLDKKDKKSWMEKLYEMQKEKKVRQKEEQQRRSGSAKDKQSETAGKAADREGVAVAFSEQGMELAKKKEADAVSEDDTETYGSKVAVNEGKRMRQIAAAKTVSEVQMVMSLLQKDLSDCEAGLKSGACDENEVKKVKALIAKAQQKMDEVRGSDSGEETDGVDAFSMNMLM